MRNASVAVAVAASLLLLAGVDGRLGPRRATAVRAAAPPPKPPLMAPLPKAVPAPKDNPTTPEKVALGAQLFFDPRLSGDNKTSCATCHRPDKSFSDGLPLAKGAGGKTLKRRTPSLLNVGFHTTFTWDGRAGSLEEQALLPIQSQEEMNQDLGELEKELNAVPGYVKQFRAVFDSRVTRGGVAKALAAFQRTLVTGPSPYDRYLAGQKQALSDEAQRGMNLFFGAAGCSSCHSGPLLSDGQFYRLVVTADVGREAVTKKKEDRSRFRTPSLRNVAVTGPYLHNGSHETLADVVTFYYRGASRSGSGQLPLDVEPLTGNSYSEIEDVIAFLRALTGEEPKVNRPKLP